MHALHNRIFNKKYMVNKDQTNVYFHSAHLSAKRRKAERTVSVKTKEFSFCLTISVAVAMDGTNLPLFILMKGNPVGRIKNSYMNCCLLMYSDAVKLIRRWTRERSESGTTQCISLIYLVIQLNKR